MYKRKYLTVLYIWLYHNTPNHEPQCNNRCSVYHIVTQKALKDNVCLNFLGTCYLFKKNITLLSLYTNFIFMMIHILSQFPQCFPLVFCTVYHFCGIRQETLLLKNNFLSSCQLNMILKLY